MTFLHLNKINLFHYIPPCVLFLFLFVCIHVCLYRYTCVYTHVEAWGQPWVLFLRSRVCCLLRWSLLLHWNTPACQGWPASNSQAFSCLCLPNSKITSICYCVQLFPGMLDINSSLHACMPKNLTTELCVHSSCFFSSWHPPYSQLDNSSESHPCNKRI